MSAFDQKSDVGNKIVEGPIVVFCCLSGQVETFINRVRFRYSTLLKDSNIMQPNTQSMIFAGGEAKSEKLSHVVHTLDLY